MNGLALCAGIGGLELACRRVFTGYKCVCFCERNSYAAATLLARMEQAQLDQAPIWDDLETFPGELFRGKVDIITSGFPCQPWSSAGARKGTDDARWLWPAIARIVRNVEPRIVFLENVPGLVCGGGLGTILGDLADLGFNAEWNCFSASEVGAPHRRKRIFILAYTAGERERESFHQEISGSNKRNTRKKPCVRSLSLGNTIRAGLESRKSKTVPKSFPTPWPPGPEAAWSEVPRTLWPALPKSQLRGVVDGIPAWVGLAWTDRLLVLGNAVVPQQAEHALKNLVGRIR